MRLGKKYEHRLDLLSFDYYGSTQYIQAILYYNKICSWNELGEKSQVDLLSRVSLYNERLKVVK